MANIKIENINFTGIELFNDSENFLDQVQDIESSSVYGGGLATFPTDTIPVDDRTVPIIMTGPPQSMDCLPPY